MTTPVYIVREHPRLELQRYEPMLNYTEFLMTKITKAAFYHMYVARVQQLRLVLADRVRSKRWAPFEPLGAAVGGIFGLASKGS